MFDVLWLGRQLVDHFGLEPEMLWVRIPPELLTFVLVEQSGVLATLSRWRSWVQIPSGTLRHGTPTWQSDQAQTLVFVGSNPARATDLGCVPPGGL